MTSLDGSRNQGAGTNENRNELGWEIIYTQSEKNQWVCCMFGEENKKRGGRKIKGAGDGNSIVLGVYRETAGGRGACGSLHMKSSEKLLE